MQPSIMLFFFSLLLYWQCSWSQERCLANALPQAKEREVHPRLPLHCLAWAIPTISDVYDATSLQMIPADCPTPGVELHRNISLGIDRLPKCLCPVVG